MKRINVIGTTGSGKSTFSAALAEHMGCPYVQMDQLFWKSNWKESSDEEFFPKLTKAISGDVWVLDGNYSRTNKIKWQRVDTIIWLDYGFIHNFFQLLKRTITRAFDRRELWPGTGNRESFSKSFLSRDSILVWFFKSYGKNRSRYSDLMQSPDYQHIDMIRLKSPNEAKQFLMNVENKHLKSSTSTHRNG